eukprot:4511388-Prymnesium_polylepis.1
MRPQVARSPTCNSCRLYMSAVLRPVSWSPTTSACGERRSHAVQNRQCKPREFECHRRTCVVRASMPVVREGRSPRILVAGSLCRRHCVVCRREKLQMKVEHAEPRGVLKLGRLVVDCSLKAVLGLGELSLDRWWMDAIAVVLRDQPGKTSLGRLPGKTSNGRFPGQTSLGQLLMLDKIEPPVQAHEITMLVAREKLCDPT